MAEKMSSENKGKFRSTEKSKRNSASKKDLKEAKKSKQLKNKRLIVRNLSFKVSEEELKKIFSEFGEVLDVNIPVQKDGKKRGFAFIQFKKTSDQIKAMKALNFKKINGRPIAIDFAVDKTTYQSNRNELKSPDLQDGSESHNEDLSVKSEDDEDEEKNSKDNISDEDEDKDEGDTKVKKFLREFDADKDDSDDDDSENESSSGSSNEDENLCADSSLKKSAVSPLSCKGVDFPVPCRKNLSLPGEGSKKNTKTATTKSFNFAESKKRKRNEHTEHIPLAEQIAAFQRKTPKRFHTTGPKAFEPTEHGSPHLVKPKSPDLRAAKRQRKNETIATETFKAAPAPVQTEPAPIKYEKKRTKIQPFSFETRDKDRMARKEQKIKEEIEKENAVFVFKAHPLPSQNPSKLPPVQKKAATIPNPFKFLLEEKNIKHRFNSSLDLSNYTQFKAQPATVLERSPFIPEKPPKQPIEIKEFHLHTDVRATERLKLKELKDRKEREKELLLEQHKRRQEKEERQEIQRLRKEAVHKAAPIRHYKAVEIKHSKKELTVPVSPKFKKDEHPHRCI